MRRTNNINKFIEEGEQKPDFDDMMSEVQEEIEEHDAEDAVVSRAPELRQLSENIDKATNTWVNATLQLESAIRKYNSAQTALGNAVEHLVDMYSLVPAYAKGSAVRETYRWFIWLGRYNILWELILCSTHFMDSHSTNVLLENCET